jgi:hypothetical protein
MQAKSSHLGDSPLQLVQAQVVASLLYRLFVFRELNKAELYSMRINPVSYHTKLQFPHE